MEGINEMEAMWGTVGVGTMEIARFMEAKGALQNGRR